MPSTLHEDARVDRDWRLGERCSGWTVVGAEHAGVAHRDSKLGAVGIGGAGDDGEQSGEPLKSPRLPVGIFGFLLRFLVTGWHVKAKYVSCFSSPEGLLGSCVIRGVSEPFLLRSTIWTCSTPAMLEASWIRQGEQLNYGQSI